MRKILLMLMFLVLISSALLVFGAQTDTIVISVYFNKQDDDLCQIIKDTINNTDGDILIAMYDFTLKSGLAEFISTTASDRTVNIVFDKSARTMLTASYRTHTFAMSQTCITNSWWLGSG